MRLTRRSVLVPGAFLAALILLASTAAARQLKPLTLEDYPRWSRITEVALSGDGRWMSYAYAPNAGDTTLHLRDLNGTTVHTALNAGAAALSRDGRWAGFLVRAAGEPPATAPRGQPASRRMELLNLASGARTSVADVQSFRFADNSRFVVIARRRADNAAKHTGADLVVRDLAAGVSRNLGNVAAFAFNKAGTLLAYTVDAAGKAGNGLYLLDPATGATTVLDSDTLRYAGLAWNEAGTALAVLRGETPAGQEQRRNMLLAWRAVGTPGQRLSRWEPGTGGAFPAGMVLSEHATPSWDIAGTRVFVGIKEQRPALELKPEADRTNVEVWHWTDDRLISQQKVQAAADARSTWAGVLHLDQGRFLRLADEAMPRIQRAGETNYALGFRDQPYRHVFDEPPDLRDVVRIDLTTGARQVLVERVRHLAGHSPDGRWHAWSSRDTLWAQEIASGRKVNLSALAGVSFTDPSFEWPGEPASYGIAAWSRDGRTVVVNHRLDLWALPLDGVGRAVNLTRGIGERDTVRFRLVSLDAEADRDGIDLAKPLVLHAFGERSKQSGYWTVEPGQAPRPLIWEEKYVFDIRKARDADRIVFTRQTFAEFPDWWATSTRFEAPRRITDANPQQQEFAWGSRVLVDYTDARGNRLQGTLTLPAGYQPGRRYPMIVYFYERLSSRHFQYSMPVYDDRPHFSTYASNGYLVLQPDITYDDGKPGSSALDDVTSATRRVIELGYADPARIGLQGHSWGGYQSSFIVTQTDMFATVVTGAPLTNLESMHNILYKGSGEGNAWILQWNQGRMGTVPWEDPEGYASQSPVRHVANIKTPFLILHGTADNAVDWNQGLEFYIAARRAGKQVILLSYPDEPHHLARRSNQIDFQRRMREYFDHYLKGAPAPPWMTAGVRFSDRDREPRP